MNVIFRDRFLKDISKIKDQKIKKRILSIIEEVKSAQNLHEIKQLKKLEGSNNAFRIRLGDFRIGFYLENNIIEFAVFMSRKEDYRRFP